MRRLALIAAASAAALLGIVVALFLAVLLLPPGDGLRHRLAESALSHYWGEPVTVSGPVTVDLWPRLAVDFHDVSSTTFDTAPVRVSRLRVVFARWLRLPFDPTVFALRVEKGRLQFPLVANSNAAPGTLLSSPVAFFSLLPRLRLDDVVFDFLDEEDGWRFSLDVSRILSRQRDGVEILDAKAALNGTPITLAFRFDLEPNPPEPGMLPYGAVLTMEGAGLTAELRTRSATPEFDETLAMTLEAHASSVGDLLALAGIARSVDGKANLKAQLLAEPDKLAMRALALDFDLSDGSHLSLTGGISDLFEGTGVDLNVLAEIDNVSPAVSPRDIAITRLSGRFQDGPHGLMLDGALVETNAFSQSLREIGPIEVAAIKRDEDGHVTFSGITVQSGPDEQPLFRLNGNVKDILGFAGISLSGGFDVPLNDILVAPSATGAQLGRLVGVAAVSDRSGTLELDRLTAELRDSPLISGKVSLAPRPGAPPDDAEKSIVDVAVQVPRLAQLAAALGSSSAFTGAVAYDGQITQSADTLASDGRLTIGRTRVDGTLKGVLRQGRPFVSGKLTSPDIHADELLALLGGGTAAPTAPRLEIVGASAPRGGSQLDLVGASDIDVEVTAQRIEGGGNAASGLSARLLLDRGAFRADPVRVTFGGGQIRAAFTDAGGGRLRAKGTGDGWPLGTLFGNAAGFSITGTAGLTFDVSSSFAAKAAPLQTLDGTVVAHVRDARLGTGLLDLAGLGLLGGLFNPAVMKGESIVRCARVPLHFTSGAARTDPAIVVETENVQAVARGTINFARDTIDLVVVPSPLDGSPGMAGYPFTIKGRLDAPNVSLDNAVQPSAHGVKGCSGE